jgi:hypothetical protein
LEFRGVAPGTYALFSWDNIEEHEWGDPEKAFKSKGASIRVTERQTKTADLTVIRIKNEQETRR